MKTKPRVADESLRDWFAGLALIGILFNMDRQSALDLHHQVKGGSIEAGAAYALADAMLAQRDKRS